MRVPRAAAILAVGLAVLAAVVFQARRHWPAAPALPSAQEALLARQNEALVKLVAAAESGTLLDFKGMLVVVSEVLVQDLLRAVTPFEADVGNGFHVKIESADAAFGDGVALVRMTGTASVGGASVGSRVTVFGAIDVVKLDPVSGVLQCGVNLVSVEASDDGALGPNDPVPRLTEALAEGGLAMLLGTLEIPISLEDRLKIPAVDSKRLDIAAEELPLTVAVQQIKVFGGRLWIFVDVGIAPQETRPGPRSAQGKS
jgi:hypothetical protein